MSIAATSPCYQQTDLSLRWHSHDYHRIDSSPFARSFTMPEEWKITLNCKISLIKQQHISSSMNTQT